MGVQFWSSNRELLPAETNQHTDPSVSPCQDVLSESPRCCPDCGQPGPSSLPTEERDDSHIDLLDMAFNYMDIEDETCRMKTICQAENYAANHPVARLAINTLNSSLRGLEKYQHAVVAGQNGEDCSLLYDQCPFTYFGLEY